MRTKIVLLFLLGWAGVVLGQTAVMIKENGNYFFNYPINDDLANFNNETNMSEGITISDIKNEVAGSSYRIKVKSVTNDKITFVFGDFSAETDLQNKINSRSKKSTHVKNQNLYDEIQKVLSDQQKSNDFKIDGLKNIVGGISKNSAKIADDKKVVYSLPLEKFKLSTKPLYNRIDWRVGVYTVPFKLRFGDFNFDANVNLGANIGAKTRWNRELESGFALEPIFGFGLASIKLDQSNSDTSNANTNVSAFTVNTGVLVHVTNSINVGFTYGFDNISKNDQNNYNWKYNGKGWLGIGINIAFSGQGNNTGGSVGNP